MLEAWVREVSWETLLNRAGTTFRKLAENDKNGLTERKAVTLMLDQPSMIKRPVLDVVASCSSGSSRISTKGHLVRGSRLCRRLRQGFAGVGSSRMRGAYAQSCTIWATRRVVPGWFRWWTYGEGPDRER